LTTVLAEPFRCQYCDTTFPSYRDLLDHQDSRHDQGPYPDTGESGETYDVEASRER